MEVLCHSVVRHGEAGAATWAIVLGQHGCVVEVCVLRLTAKDGKAGTHPPSPANDTQQKSKEEDQVPVIIVGDRKDVLSVVSEFHDAIESVFRGMFNSLWNRYLFIGC